MNVFLLNLAGFEQLLRYAVEHPREAAMIVVAFSFALIGIPLLGAGWIVRGVKQGEHRRILQHDLDVAASQRQQDHDTMRKQADAINWLAYQLGQHYPETAPAQITEQPQLTAAQITDRLLWMLKHPGQCAHDDFEFFRLHWPSGWWKNELQLCLRDGLVTPEQLGAFANSADTPLDVAGYVYPVLRGRELVPDDLAGVVVTQTGTMIRIPQ